MPLLTFNLLLKDAGLDPKDVYLVRHKDTRIGQALLKQRGSSPYELWRSKSGQFEIYQRLQSKDCFRNRKWIASFVAAPNGDTLFVGMYQKLGYDQWPEGLTACPVTNEPVSLENHFYYNLAPSELLGEFKGKLTVVWGSGFLAWHQNADSKDSGNKQVLEIRTEITEPPFPGFRNLIIKNLTTDLHRIPESWKNQLKACKGVYLLTCNQCQTMYVGKADGEDGFYGRFAYYATTVHGGNEGMKAHSCTKGYSATLLEAIAIESHKEVGTLESLWKEKLGTRGKNGLNLN